MANGLRTRVRIEGLEELRRRLRALPVAVQQKELTRAVARGAAVIRDEAKARVPILKAPHPYRTPGTLKRMIRSSRGKRRDSEASAFVMVRQLSKRAIAKFKEKTKRGAATNPNDPFYWRFVEFGTSMMQAMPFLRPAFDSKKEKAAEEVKRSLVEGVERQAKQLGGK